MCYSKERLALTCSLERSTKDWGCGSLGIVPAWHAPQLRFAHQHYTNMCGGACPSVIPTSESIKRSRSIPTIQLIPNQGYMKPCLKFKKWWFSICNSSTEEIEVGGLGV